MGLISPSLPTVGQPNSTEDAKVLSALQTLTNVINGNIDTANIATNGVGTAEIADGAVTTAKIPDGAITSTKFASGSQPFLKLASLSDRKIAFGANNNAWSAGNVSSDVGTVTHGLGVTPVVVIATTGANVHANVEVFSFTSTTFQILQRNIDGAAPGAGVTNPFYWLALG